MSKQSKKLTWNVYREDFNGRKIEIYNVLGTGYMEDKLKGFKKKFKKELKTHSATTCCEVGLNDKWVKEYKEKVFAEELKNAIQYQYWARCEYEVVITSWPPYLTMEEMDRLNKEEVREGRYRVCPEMEIAEKIDIYDQVRLNWDVFVDYVWNNYMVCGNF